MYKCAVASLGCKVNQCEAEALKEEMRSLGYSIVEFSEKADVYIINTCCVTAEGERKSRQTVRRAKGINEKAIRIIKNSFLKDANVICANEGLSQITAVINTDMDSGKVYDICNYVLTRLKIECDYSQSSMPRGSM